MTFICISKYFFGVKFPLFLENEYCRGTSLLAIQGKKSHKMLRSRRGRGGHTITLHEFSLNLFSSL